MEYLTVSFAFHYISLHSTTVHAHVIVCNVFACISKSDVIADNVVFLQDSSNGVSVLVFVSLSGIKVCKASGEVC